MGDASPLALLESIYGKRNSVELGVKMDQDREVATRTLDEDDLLIYCIFAI